MKEITRLFSYTKQLRHYMVVVTLGSVIMALLGMATPILIKFATDAITSAMAHKSADMTLIFWLVVGLGIANVLSAILSDVSGYVGDQLAIRLRRQLSEQYYQHLLTLPQGYYDEEVTGKIINRLNRAIADIAQFINFFSNNLLQMLLTIALSIIVMAWYSWPLALLVLIQIPAYLYLTAKTSKKWQKLEKKKNEHFDISSGRFAEVIGQMRLVKSFGSQTRELGIFKEHYSSVIRLTKTQSIYWHKMSFLRNLVRALVYTGVFGVLFYDAAMGKMTIGDMVMILTLVQQTSFPLQNMSFFVDMYQRAVANSKDYAEAMNEKPEVVSETGKQVLNADHATIVYRDVDFAYGKEKKVLHDISFTVDAGKKLALVGESGGGKSTLANLLMRLYTPQKGGVYINDVNIQDVTQASLRSNIATVFQEASLFSGTIRENICYGRPDASEEEIVAAAKAANAYDFIKKLKDGFDSEIGERGIKLSGGQKQRLAIARAVLKDAPILILDEATSSLDSRAEHEVQEALDRLMHGRTVLIIAHRLSTIAGVDTIVTLKGGHVDEIGSPSELAKTNGIYAQLLDLQMGTTERAKKKLKSFDIAG